MHPHIDELAFHKSSYSDRNNCVEVARFRKSSYSGARTENCVEVADLPTGAAVRDTQNRELGALAFPSLEWSALLRVAQ
ncbi:MULTISPECIES: DUF397 domain-containing protein [unclassified Nocardiopsis]|uniref:DUF397 domain-containing protein n=1 Tax=unclassified Nocardiopsis TaxID=2649073 RepID=UPI00066C0849|nr:MULTISPECIES: DUF397 domain-containing protein [unclassified Nocardiopsis]MBQ1084139.1 DUF397 domain-containing protein [Nocardiopsis sp. B62]